MSLQENQFKGPTIQLKSIDLNFRNVLSTLDKHLRQYSIQTTGDEVIIPGYNQASKESQESYLGYTEMPA